MFILFDVTHERDRRTDRETDGHCMTAKTALASHRAVKNSPNLTLYLFCKMKTSNHCLHPLLPPDRTLNQVLRTRGHSFQLPTCSFNLHKKSFVISCLFKFLTCVCSCFVCVVFSFLDCFFSNVLLISVYHV